MELRETYEFIIEFADKYASAKREMEALVKLNVEDFLPLGIACNYICNGYTKNDAFEVVTELFREVRHENPNLSSDGVIKVINYSENRTLLRKWNKHKHILPYIRIYYLRNQFADERNQILDHKLLETTVSDFVQSIQETKRYRPIKFQTLKQLVFLPSSSFSEFVSV